MNRLTVSHHHSILTLAERGYSARKIARELGIHRETVGRYLRPKPAKVTTGSEEAADSKPANVTAGLVRCRSGCEPWRAVIEGAIEQGLSAVRIHQDLVGDRGFTGSYEAVKRFVRRCAAKSELPFRRLEHAPGEELQVDFGTGAWVLEEGKKRRPHLFRAVLSYSRKGYTEVVWQQSTEAFIRCLENAFRHFGGAPVRLVIDNLKAGVLRADWFDPDLNPKLVEFCRHYGTVLAPTKPAMPRHKGKVENGVGYAQGNALKGRVFSSLAEQNLFLAEWERTVADTRIHGTVRAQVLKRFLEGERPALRPLPPMLFPCFEEVKRSVQRDVYVNFRCAYYSAPPEYVRLEVWVRAEARLVRLYNLRREQIAVHARADRGGRQTDQAHIHPHKRALVELGAQALLARCRRLGPGCGAWAEAMYQHRGDYGVGTLHGLLHLAKQHPVHALEAVSVRALAAACWRLRDLRALLAQDGRELQLGFLQAHPLIRDLSAYRIAFPHDDHRSA